MASSADCKVAYYKVNCPICNKNHPHLDFCPKERQAEREKSHAEYLVREERRKKSHAEYLEREELRKKSHAEYLERAERRNQQVERMLDRDNLEKEKLKIEIAGAGVSFKVDGAGVKWSWCHKTCWWWWMAKDATWQSKPLKKDEAALHYRSGVPKPLLLEESSQHKPLRGKAAAPIKAQSDANDAVSDSGMSSASTRASAWETPLVLAAVAPAPAPAASPTPATPVSTKPQEPPLKHRPEGLDSILSAAKVNPEDREKIIVWCQEQDAAEISEVLECLDDIEALCCLKKLTRSRLEKALTATCAGATSS